MYYAYEFFRYPQCLGTPGLVALGFGTILGLRLFTLNRWNRSTIVQVVLFFAITIFGLKEYLWNSCDWGIGVEVSNAAMAFNVIVASMVVNILSYSLPKGKFHLLIQRTSAVTVSLCSICITVAYLHHWNALNGPDVFR